MREGIRAPHVCVTHLHVASLPVHYRRAYGEGPRGYHELLVSGQIYMISSSPIARHGIAVTYDNSPKQEEEMRKMITEESAIVLGSTLS